MAPTNQVVRLEIAIDEAKAYDTLALNGRMIRIVGEFGYDSDNRTYQWQKGSFKPFRSPGWTLVNTRMPKPMAHSVKGAKKKSR